MGKLILHVLAHIAYIEGFQVTEMLGVKKHQYRHPLAVGKTAWTVAALLAWGVNKMFFQFWSEIFAELVENAENFY